MPINNELYQEVKKLQKQANQRIARLEKSVGKETWATKTLRNELATETLQAWSVSSRIKVNKEMTNEQLLNIKNLTDKFLRSKTSTLRGIKQIKSKQIKQIKKDLNTDFDNEKFSNEDAEFFYENLFADDTSWIYKYITPSAFEGVITEGISRKRDEDSWINLLWSHANAEPDIDIKEKSRNLYKKFVLPYI